MNIKALSLALVVLLVSGCHQVIDTPGMMIYEKRANSSLRLGKFTYSVRDGSVKGWEFITDKDLNVGDVLVIEVKK